MGYAARSNPRAYVVRKKDGSGIFSVLIPNKEKHPIKAWFAEQVWKVMAFVGC